MLTTSGAFTDTGLGVGLRGSLNEDNITSCLESTLGFVLEQITPRTDSCSREELEELCRTTSIDEDVPPIK